MKKKKRVSDYVNWTNATNQPTDTASYRCAHMKKKKLVNEGKRLNSILELFLNYFSLRSQKNFFKIQILSVFFIFLIDYHVAEIM